MSENRLMKDGLGPDAVRRIGDALKMAYPSFQRARFESNAIDGLDRLELKERVHHIIDVLEIHLPAEFEEAAVILHEIPDVLDPGDPDDNLRGFAAWPFIDFVGVHGLDHPETALPLLARLTPMFSAEFAVRPFIRDHIGFTMKTMKDWTRDPNPHVRRLVSEGSRPRLPWGMRLKQFVEDPAPILPLLESLKDDESEFVRRSVANNLNDIAKDHPELVIEICTKWSVDAPESRLKLVRHALRTLVKSGHPDVYPLLGYARNPEIEVVRLDLEADQLKLGDDLRFSAEILGGAADQTVVVDFAIHFVKANGERSPKVFKLRDVHIENGQSVILTKKHPIKPITTRRYYSGGHILALHVNGREIARRSFHLDT